MSDLHITMRILNSYYQEDFLLKFVSHAENCTMVIRLINHCMLLLDRYKTQANSKIHFDFYITRIS